jgi:hypothetical protein
LPGQRSGEVEAEQLDRVSAGDLGDRVLAEVAELERGFLAGEGQMPSWCG